VCLAALPSACTQEEEFVPVPAGTNIPVTFVSAPDDAPGTRVTAYSRWQVNDRIGVYMVEAGQSLAQGSIVNGAANRQYRVESIQNNRAVFVPATGSDTIFIPMRKKVNFIAYYPYTQAIDKDFNFSVTNLSKQDVAPPSDLLFSNMKEEHIGGTYPKNISLLFRHQLAKVKLNINRGHSVPPLSNDIKVKIKNVRIDPLNFSLVNGIMAIDGAANNTTLYAKVSFNSSENATAEALLIPVAHAEQVSAVVEINNGANTYSTPLKSSDGSLRAANTYNYEVILGDPIPIDWVHINAGAFMMGSPPDELDRMADETRHQVTLTKDFKMSKYEITCEQYASFLNQKKIGSNARDYVDDFGMQDLIKLDNPNMKWENAQWKPVNGKEKYPITHVTWFGAKAFADWMGCSLPTEAQMEYALRAGTQTTYFFNIADTDKYIWYKSNSGNALQPVGEKLPNPWGLHDIVGNVHEYCVDWYQANLGTQPVTDPVYTTPPTSNQKRCHRGGSFTDWSQRYHRSAARSNAEPWGAFWNVGFRLVYVPE
jgi:formylglycine-generating enzyme required for sulfatase activity